MSAALTDAQLLARLVAFDSTSANSNLPIADFVCDYLRADSIEIIRNLSHDETKVNLVIRVGGRGEKQATGAGLLLSGHLDVVPATEPEWRTDPFTLSETDDTYVGRGACDMKGFVALAINVARAAATRRLRHPLALLLTFDEEIGTLGAQHFVKSWEGAFNLPTAALIGEPTSLRPVRMHKGHLAMRITLRGISAHSGYPHLGRSAIEPAGRVIEALSNLRARLEGERVSTSDFFPECPHVALNVARITGGSAVNIIPDRCVIELGARVLPGMSSDAMIERIRETVAGVVRPDDCSIDVDNISPPLLTREDASLYQTLCAMVSQDDRRGVSYASDAGPLCEMGLECVLFGPGSIEVAHKPNESLPKGEFVEARKYLERLVHEYCD